MPTKTQTGYLSDGYQKLLADEVTQATTDVATLQSDVTTLQSDVVALEAEGTVLGVAAGYAVARGTITPSQATETIVTGLATVVVAVASLKGAPTLTHMFVEADIGDQAGSPAAGSILLRSKKPTAAGDVTPIDATSPWSAVDWIALGTL